MGHAPGATGHAGLCRLQFSGYKHPRNRAERRIKLQRPQIIAVMALSLLVVTGCTIPRGAALSTDILNEQQNENATYQVVQVTRANVDALLNWPVTGWEGRYHWVSNPRGPQSQLIRSGDKVSVVVWDNQENSLLATPSSKQVTLPLMTVSPTGTIFMPYLGEVDIRNMTQSDARMKIQEAMTEVVPSAQVQLSVQQGESNSADLVSGVSSPGSYPLPSRNYTILSLIAAGGGIQSSLRHPVVRLIRGSNAYEIRAEKLMANPALNTTLRGGDKVIVEEDQRFFTALGTTGREEIVPFKRETMTAMEALSSVGGLSDTRTDLKSVLVLRDYPADKLIPRSAADENGWTAKGPLQTEVVFAFDLTTADGLFAARKFQINPQDTVFGTEAVVSSARTVVGLIGSVVGLSNQVSNLTD